MPSVRGIRFPSSDALSFAGQPYLAVSAAAFFASSAALALAAAAFASASAFAFSSSAFLSCTLTIGPSLHDHQGRMNDVGISAAAADIAVEPLPHFFFRGLGILVEERTRRHDEAGRAESALLGVTSDKSGRNWVFGEAFDRGDLFADAADRQFDAGGGRFAV